MKFFVRFCPILLFLLLCTAKAEATHNRAGEIRIRQINALTIEATIITWTKTSSVQADRDTLTINWGDGSFQAVKRVNGKGEILPNDIKRNIYVATHTYAGPATYVVSMTDPNRNAGILNVNAPSSDNVPFHLETVYKFQDPQFGGTNNTPELLQPPIDVACVGQPFRHNPNASDPEGDSLSFHLIVPLQSRNQKVPNYRFPDEILPGPNNKISLDERTGQFEWNSPQVQGEYNIAFVVVSYRNGRPIDSTIRDMQVLVEKCNNRPPVVTAPTKFCVIAGDSLVFKVSATDPDSANLVQLTALGAPFNSKYSPATFTVPSGFREPVVTGTFRWKTSCEHISNQPYSVVFKALDSLKGKNISKLADLKNVSIKVVGPPPKNVAAKAQLGEVEITWEKPYRCEDAAEKYFFTFSVWRREGSNPFSIDTCEPGLAGKGYMMIANSALEEKNGRYYYKDAKVERGRTYCYRILARFGRISTGGYRYNLVESLASDEVCVQLPRDLPLITNVSVEKTDANNGLMMVRWTKPLAKDLDTLLNPGPYRYQLFKANGLSGGTLQEVPGASFVSQWFKTANDTMFTDQVLDTKNQAYRYQVGFYIRGDGIPVGKTNPASSVFLSIKSTDKTNILSWQENVPWNNYDYEIYRKNAAGQFELIGNSNTKEYYDRGLTNLKEYCYYVRSVGTYSINGVPDPLLNKSQETCGIPIDTIPPCVPVLTVRNACDEPGAAIEPPYENNLKWNNPNLNCGFNADAVGYKIWYAPSENQPLVLLETIEGANNTGFIHRLTDGLAGCYAVSAIDSVGNESAKSSPLVCKDNCPLYELPNVFTPNGDNQNDLYTPFPNWRFIEKVDFKVFNRWGNLVFSATDPQLNWTGKDSAGNDLSEGTYFYTCRVFEKRVSGAALRPDVLSGYIELVRGGR